MSLAEAFQSIALGFSAAVGGPYYPGKVIRQGAAVYDDGGSIVTPGVATELDCSVQVDDATERMRGEAGFADTDVALLILGVDALDTDAVVAVLSGPRTGRWTVASVSRDPAGCGWVARGRRGA